MLDRLIGVQRQPGQIPAGAILPLRAFLGLTFVYAGLYKLTDPQFFSPTAPGYIGQQMSGFVRTGSPLSPLLTHLALPHAALFGALIAFGELWVGLSALTGLLTRLGALGGLALSLTFYLTATWSVHPYFLGADLPYALGWLTLAFGGAGPYSLDEHIFGAPLRAGRHAAHATGRPGSGSLAQAPLARAAFLRGLGAAMAVVAAGGLTGTIARVLTPRSGAGATRLSSAAPTTGSHGGAGATFLGNVRALPVNSAAAYTDPLSGDPALLIRLPDGRFVAYDAVCTHAGCTVQYDATQQALVCPCHGAIFDPAQGARVLAGPAPQPLAPLQVRIDRNGQAYAAGTGSSHRPRVAQRAHDEDEAG